MSKSIRVSDKAYKTAEEVMAITEHTTISNSVNDSLLVAKWCYQAVKEGGKVVLIDGDGVETRLIL